MPQSPLVIGIRGKVPARRSDQDDFGRHIIPDAIHKVGVFAHTFEGYWEDIGTIRSFYEANLALTDPQPPFDFYRADAPVYTHPRFGRGSSGALPDRARDRLRGLVYRLCPDRAFGYRNSLDYRRGMSDCQCHHYGG